MRLIDANELLGMEKILATAAHLPESRVLMEQALYDIEHSPTIDAVPVVHGRWVRAAGKSNIWYCSVCGDKINYKQNRRTYNIPKVPVEQKNKFCRNCGAKMEGRAEG